MIEIKENIAIITRDPFTFDIEDMVDSIRRCIADYMETEYTEEEIVDMDYSDYKTLANYILEKAKIS